jgi:hypothetical protein
MKKGLTPGNSIAIAVFLTLSTLSPVLTPLQLSAQTPTANNATATSNTLGTNVSGTPSPAAAQLIQKVERIPSLSNIIGMSMVEGIKVSGLQIGDTDLTVTLRRHTAGSNLTQSAGNSSSMPVTIIATKLPIANLTQVLTTAQSTLQLAASNRAEDAALPIFPGQESNPQAGSAAVQILSLVRNLQMGTASIVSANWTTPQNSFDGTARLGQCSGTTSRKRSSACIGCSLPRVNRSTNDSSSIV